MIKTLNKKTTFTEEQRLFIEADLKASIILKATAGSGKTFSLTERVRYLIEQGIDPSRILFFSYTVAAVEEFKRRLNDDRIKITTIHSFCQSLLAQMGKYKNVVNIYDFLAWYKQNCKPSKSAPAKTKAEFYEKISDLYQDAEYLSSEIAAFKLQSASGIKCKVPDLIKEYKQFCYESKSRDFSDMLIEVYESLKENKWLNKFKNKYDYVLIDEFQDTSLIQIEIIKRLNPKYITCAGDINQSIFGYSGANVHEVIKTLKKFRNFKEMTLSINFRSGKNIVENSNNYADLIAIPSNDFDGSVNKKIILLEKTIDILKENEEVVFLCRTNKVIKEIEKHFLINKIPFNFKSYFTEKELEQLRGNIEHPNLNNTILDGKLRAVLNRYKNIKELLEFIDSGKSLKKYAMSIHKSKGLEFDTCIVVNCFSPELIEYNKLKLDEKSKNHLSFDMDKEEDFEAKNVFYVSITRPIRNLSFLYV